MRLTRQNVRRGIAAAIAVAGFWTLTTACTDEETTALRQVEPNSVVFIQGYQGDEVGDRAQIEKKPSGLWVLPEEAAFRNTKTGDFKVRVRLTTGGQWVIEKLNGVRVGYDHDNCLSNEEQYAKMAAKDVKFDRGEQRNNGDNANDDCVRGGEVDDAQVNSDSDFGSGGHKTTKKDKRKSK